MAETANGFAHDHNFLGDAHRRNERRIWLVIALTATMMVAEIVAGNLFGSMALVADGWHMSTHAGALLIAAVAYLVARREVGNPRFTFGTGKLGDLAAFASAIVLLIVALLIGSESVIRLGTPVEIHFHQSLLVAGIGLVVNLASAWLLRDNNHHPHHDHHHVHDHRPDNDHRYGDASGTGAQDHNLQAAYFHVLADALISVLAILALLLGALYGWVMLDPLMGIVGAVVIAHWSWGLLRATGAVLLDLQPAGESLPGDIRRVLEAGGDRVTDLHVWQLGPGHQAAIVSLTSRMPEQPVFYKEKLARFPQLSHVTVEVARA